MMPEVETGSEEPADVDEEVREKEEDKRQV